MVGLDALARRAALHVHLDVRWQALPPDRSARERQCLVPAEVAAQRRRVELVENLQRGRTSGRRAAPAVEDSKRGPSLSTKERRNEAWALAGFAAAAAAIASKIG